VPGPLDGILVLDLSRVLAGPFCTMLLADLGARVIKVEHPGSGDVTRGWGPPDHAASGFSAYYLSVNRNKESIALDLATPEGRTSVEMLAKHADVLVENFAPGGLRKLGLSLEELRRENPGLVTASITGFGRVGPDADAPGFDLLAQAGAGLMAITGEPDGAPTKVGVAVSDLLAGSYCAIGIVAALRRREKTGAGTHVETDLFSATLASLVNVAEAALVTGVEGRRHGNAHPQIVPYRPFQAADGEFILAVGTDPQFARLCAIVDRPEWKADSRFVTNAARVENRRQLEDELETIFAREPRRAWLERCRSAGIPAGPVRGPLEALRSETARALDAVRESGGLPFVVSPIRVSGHQAPLAFPPALDAQGDSLRREFGLPPAARGSGR
jgi:crotonobetainyl-CoA:carnitine CoA-transferase CaiB-like acyl-CoA transferase